MGEENVTSEAKQEDAKKVIGTIVITLYQDHPSLVEFTGHLTGRHINSAFRSMLKQYRIWNSTNRKK